MDYEEIKSKYNFLVLKTNHIDLFIDYLTQMIRQDICDKLEQLLKKNHVESISLRVKGFPGYEDKIITIELTHETIQKLLIIKHENDIGLHIFNEILKTFNEEYLDWKSFLHAYLVVEKRPLLELLEIIEGKINEIIDLIERLINKFVEKIEKKEWECKN